MSTEKPKYSSIDEIIDAHRTRLEPPKPVAKEGQWVFTKDKVYKWFSKEDLEKSGIKLATAQPELPEGSFIQNEIVDGAYDGQD